MDNIEKKTKAESNNQASQPSASGSKNKKSSFLLPGIVIIVILIVAALAYFVAPFNFGGGEAAATVNGEVIAKKDLELRVERARQGQSQITEQQVLDQMIGEELIVQDAATNGIVVTKEELNQQYNQLVQATGGEEQLKVQLKEVGLTESSLKTDIERQIIVQKYLEQAIDTDSITATEEEIEAAYENEKDRSDTELPPLTEIRDDVEAFVIQLKQNQLVTQVISGLRDNAVVEVLI